MEFTNSKDAGVPDLIGEFYDELAQLDPTQISLLLKNLDPARVMMNHEEVIPEIATDAAHEFDICLSLIVNKYGEKKMAAGATSLDCLVDITAIAAAQASRVWLKLSFRRARDPPHRYRYREERDR